MVDRMVVLPAQERGVEKQPQGRAEPRVGAPGGEEGAVRAIVKDDEGAHKKHARRDRYGEHEQIRHPQCEIHREGEREVGHDGSRYT